MAAVYAENQTAGRGRQPADWVNAEGKALYYTVAIKEPLAQPPPCRLAASLAGAPPSLKFAFTAWTRRTPVGDLFVNGKIDEGI